MMDDDTIPSIETYRDVPIHAGQKRKRVAVVKQAIDRVCEITDLGGLFAVLNDPSVPPEARLLAGNKILASFTDATSSRLTRPRGVDFRTVEGITACLSSNRWRCPTHFGTLLEPQAGLVRR